MWPSSGRDKQDYNYEIFGTTPVMVIVTLLLFYFPEMATYLVDAYWRIFCNKTTSSYCCAFVGVNIVFI